MPHLQSCAGISSESFLRRAQNFLGEENIAESLGCLKIPGIEHLYQLSPSNRQRQRDLVGFLSSALHEPEKQIRGWLERNRKFLKDVESYRNKRQANAKLHAHKESFLCPQEYEFKKLCNSDVRSRLLVSYHFGDFVYGNNVLASFESRARQQSFLTQLSPGEEFLQNMRNCFGQAEFDKRDQLTLDSVSSSELLATLRNSGQTLLSFVDLPAGFGERIEVSFLGRRAWFPKGPAALCLASKTPILPVINVRNGLKNIIHLSEQIEPATKSSESFHCALTRITQTLVHVLEEFVTLCPWQWRFLSALPSYYLEPQVKN